MRDALLALAPARAGITLCSVNPAQLLTASLLLAFIAPPFAGLARDWWVDPEASHGLLLAPVAVWLAWRAGVVRDATPSRAAGLIMLAGAVLVRYAADLSAEVYTGRLSIVIALSAIAVYHLGFRQLRAWWLPLTLLVLSVPPPSVIISAISLPLQFQASRMGAAFLEARHVPVLLSGNIIRLPNHDLFVAEACSGLRSLTALGSISVLAAGMWLNNPVGRIFLVLSSIPIAIGVNAVRVFITGYAIHFIGPEAGKGVLHATEGWLLFVVSLSIVFGLALGVSALERTLRREHHVPG